MSSAWTQKDPREGTGEFSVLGEVGDRTQRKESGAGAPGRVRGWYGEEGWISNVLLEELHVFSQRLVTPGGSL